jgi:hypothetical protein
MTVNDFKRYKIFELYASNINLICKERDAKIGYEDDNGVFNEPEYKYICPICSKLYILGSLDQKTENPLTLEDVPPKKLGGKPIILTCKSCNNNSGNMLDSKLKWHLEIEPFLKKETNSKINAYYEINKRTKVKGQLVYVQKGKYGLHFNLNSNPNLNRELDYFVKNWDKSTIRFTFQMPNQKKVLLALLRIAHLKMFAEFGYGYFLNPSINTISNQLHDPNLDIISNFDIPIFDSVTDQKEGIYFVISPKELRSFLVVFNLHIDGRNKMIPVVIPGPDNECTNIYSKMKDYRNFEVELLSIPKVNYLTNPNNIFAYNEMWDSKI